MNIIFFALWIIYGNAFTSISSPQIYHMFRPLKLSIEPGKKLKKVDIIWKSVTGSSCADLILDGESLGSALISDAEHSWKADKVCFSGKIEFQGLVQVVNVKLSYYKEAKGEGQWLYPGQSVALPVSENQLVSSVLIRASDYGGDSRIRVSSGKKIISESSVEDGTEIACEISGRHREIRLTALTDVVFYQGSEILYKKISE